MISALNHPKTWHIQLYTLSERFIYYLRASYAHTHKSLIAFHVFTLWPVIRCVAHLSSVTLGTDPSIFSKRKCNKLPIIEIALQNNAPLINQFCRCIFEQRLLWLLFWWNQNASEQSDTEWQTEVAKPNEKKQCNMLEATWAHKVFYLTLEKKTSNKPMPMQFRVLNYWHVELLRTE